MWRPPTRLGVIRVSSAVGIGFWCRVSLVVGGESEAIHAKPRKEGARLGLSLEGRQAHVTWLKVPVSKATAHAGPTVLRVVIHAAAS